MLAWISPRKSVNQTDQIGLGIYGCFDLQIENIQEQFGSNTSFLQNTNNCLLITYALIINPRDEVAEWLRRWTANPLCFAREGSNPFLVEFPLFLVNQKLNLNWEKKYLTAVGFEPTPAFADQNTHLAYKLCFKLESGALDRSATLSYKIKFINILLKSIQE